MDFNNYSEMTDQALAEEVKKGNAEAGNELMRRYVPLVKKLCQLKGLGSLAEDLEQELWCGFFEIVRKYDEKKAKFSTTAKALLLAKRKDFLRKEVLLRNKELSFEDSLLSKETDDVYPSIETEEYNDFIHDMKLTERQRQILCLLEKGYTNSTEVGRLLGISQQCAHRQIETVRKKASKILTDRV